MGSLTEGPILRALPPPLPPLGQALPVWTLFTLLDETLNLWMGGGDVPGRGEISITAS